MATRAPVASKETQGSSSSLPNTWKPIIVMISPCGLKYWRRFRQCLLRMQRDARLMYVPSVNTLNSIIEDYEDDIAGFVVTDASVMDSTHVALTETLAGILFHYPKKEWTIVFAFDFAWQAMERYPAFARYMDQYFGIDWKLAGKTKGKMNLQFRVDVTRKLSDRVYGSQYHMRGVVLSNVKQSDKVLVAVPPFRDDWFFDLQLGFLRKNFPDVDEDKLSPARILMDDEGFMADVEDNDVATDEEFADCAETFYQPMGSNDDWDPYEDENENEDKEEDEDQDDATDATDDDDDPNDEDYVDEDEEMTEATEEAPYKPPTKANMLTNYKKESKAKLKRDDNWVPSDDEGTAEDKKTSNCPVALHEYKTKVKYTKGGGHKRVVAGYLGFVGHFEDHTGMAALILGMCSVEAVHDDALTRYKIRPSIT